MTGPEHYRSAEMILRVAAEDIAQHRGVKMPGAVAAQHLQEYQANMADAQVHATLALADAVAALIDRMPAVQS